ncbi:hypothetical protein NPIL_518561 [Nephila pilipes]|uniref:Uncharacterized protein n=1 Tax=Nephila pilipes TaxID=299642 RepID=A0A8X6NPI6_NEPPI|nr:hypothetical protein NPIL_518561 [Nephila pilipes]
MILRRTVNVFLPIDEDEIVANVTTGAHEDRFERPLNGIEGKTKIWDGERSANGMFGMEGENIVCEESFVFVIRPEVSPDMGKH